MIRPEPAKPEPVRAEPASKSFRIERATSLQERCSLYLEQTPPAISGEGGHGATFNVRCRVVELFAELSDDELFASLEEWNRRCVPPWESKELKRKINEARKKVGGVSEGASTPNEDVYPSIAPVASDGFPSLGEAAYHGLAGKILRLLDPVTEADQASILMTFLSAFGVIVGRGPHFTVEGTEHHANLFCVLVGQSSKARKGTSLGRVLELLKQAPLKHLSGISTGEGLIQEVSDANDNKKTVIDKRRWIVESEFARCLSVMKREGNTLSSILRDAWDTGHMYVLTKNTPLTATNAHIGITSHITQEELVVAMGQTEMFNGFGNRFLWAFVKRSKCLPDGGSVDLSGLQKEIGNVVAKAKDIGRMTRSKEAAELWRQVYPILGSEKSGIWDAVTSRAEAQVVRLSILYALLDGSAVIEVNHLKAALAVWDYCDQSAKLLFSDPDSIDNQILNIVNMTPGIKRSEARLQFNHDKKTTVAFNAAVASLVRKKEICLVTVKAGRQADLLYPPAESKSTISSFQGERGVTPATVVELFMWKNMNGIGFEKRGVGGEYWVTPASEAKLTPAIEAAIRLNQSIVSAFVTPVTVTAPEHLPEAPKENSEGRVSPADEVLTDEEFLKEMTEM